MSELIFDETLHRYVLDGQVLPSVTQVLKPLYDFSFVNPDLLRRAAEYGTALHKTVELYLKNDLDEDSLDDALKGPLDAFKEWQRATNEVDPIIETFCYHPRLKYAGTPDLAYPHSIIDIKSRPVNMLTDPIQLAAYDHFGKGNRARFVLELKQDGTYNFTRVNPTKKSGDLAWSRFRYLLDYYNATKEIERWK